MKRDRWEVGPATSREPREWRVKRNGDVMGYTDTQRDGITLAVSLCWKRWYANAKTATLKIKRPDGTIRDERTYPRSSDPRSSRG